MYKRNLRPDELMHYGVLGMKWGVRRYQPYAVVPRGKSKAPGIEIGEAKRLTRQMDKLEKGRTKDVVDSINATANVYKRQQKVNKRKQKYNNKKSKWNTNRLNKANRKLEEAVNKQKKIAIDASERYAKYSEIGKKLVKNNYNVYVKDVDDERYLNGKVAAEIALSLIGGNYSGIRKGLVTHYTGDANYYTLTQKRRKHKVRQSNTDPNKDKFVIK